MIRSIVRENKELRKAFIKRRKELNWTQTQLAEEANKLGRPEIRRQSINRYENEQLVPGILNDDQIIFLAALLDINVSLVIRGYEQEYDIKRAYRKLSKYENKKFIAPKPKKPEKSANKDIEEIPPFKSKLKKKK